jgi:phosphatidylserine/phosphatidylglycerophosphate/cardiolipin synthase-like enzyme
MSQSRGKTSNFTVAVSTLAVLVLLVNSNSLTGKGPSPVLETDRVTSTVRTGGPSASFGSYLLPGALAPTATVAPTLVHVSSKWEVYFTDPLKINTDPQNENKKKRNWEDSIEARLIAQIHAAKTSIHIASYEFDLPRVAEALIAAAKAPRNVKVLWVTDDVNGCGVQNAGQPASQPPNKAPCNNELFKKLRANGIGVAYDGNKGAMHNKFWIFDRETVWTGSTNITESGIFNQFNNTIVIKKNRKLAALYEAEFQEMWGKDGKSGTFGPVSPGTPKAPSGFVDLKDGTEIEVMFTPDSNAMRKIIEKVQCATTSIYFLAYGFTDEPLAMAMLQRAKEPKLVNCLPTTTPQPKETGKAVDVKGLFDFSQQQTELKDSEIKTLACGKVLLRRVDYRNNVLYRYLHDKVIVVDRRYVITGSMNFSGRGNTLNDENVLLIDNPKIAELYIARFEHIWNSVVNKEDQEKALQREFCP